MYEYKMQTEASVLPVVQLNVHKTLNSRKSEPDSKSSTLESKKLSSCRSTLPQSNKKCLNPLLGGPYKNSIKQQLLSNESKSGNKSVLGQRVMSAKMLRFKQLQNQLADAHYHLNELANENRLLKALQKRQDSALRRYEGTNAELPRIINSHHEELRVLQTKYKKLKVLHKDTCNLLKEKENELYSVNSQNKHLLQLSKDRNLGEREKLQLQISDMNHEIQQQEETIQLLHRKLALETKSLKHQLHVEISKHKETQKNLEETIEKLKNLECLLDNRERRLYYNGQLPIYSNEKNLGSHSLTNLGDISVSNPVKAPNGNRKSKNGMQKDNLPSFDTLESNDDEKMVQRNNIYHDHSIDQLKSETMASLQQIRKFRLQKSLHVHKNAHSMDDLRLRSEDPEVKAHDNEKVTLYHNTLVDFKAMPERNLNNNKNESGKLRKLFNRMKRQNSEKLQKELDIEFDYSSDDGENRNANEYHLGCCPTDTAQKSRELYARLISSTDDTSDTLDDMMKKATIHYSDEEKEEEEELNTHLTKDLTFQKNKHKNKLKVLQHHRNKDLCDSGSEVDSEENIDANEDYSSIKHKANSFQTNVSKYEKRQCLNKSFNNVTYPECKTSEIKERFVTEELRNADLQRIPDNAPDNIYMENVEAHQQSLDAKKIWLEEQYLSENNEINNTFTDIKEENYAKEEEEAEYSGDKPAYTDISYDKVYHDIFKQNNAYEEMKSLRSPERKEAQNIPQQIHKEHESISRLRLVDTKETEYVTSGNSKTISNKNKFMLNHPDRGDHSMHNIAKEHRKSVAEEISNIINHSDEGTQNKNDSDVKTKNKLIVSLESEDIDTSSNNLHVPHQTEQNNDTRSETTGTREINNKKKAINYNKEKLLATMQAIDDNENIEFLNQGFKNHNMMNRMQITENLFRGLPTHSKPKRDIIKDIFEDNHVENKAKGTCSKSH